MAGFPHGFPIPLGGQPASSGLFSRLLRRLLPTGQAWRGVTSVLSGFLDGIGVEPSMARDFADLVYLDLFPEDTREIGEWRSQFGLFLAPDSTMVNSVAGAWQATGGQSPYYLQTTVQAAGFSAFIFDWLSWDGDPWNSSYTVKDPHAYTTPPLVGTAQCGEPDALCGEAGAHCNTLLVNEPGYLVNVGLNQQAPPAIPNDAATYGHFVYWGGREFGTVALIEAARRREFEDKLLALCPAEKWIVTQVKYTESNPPPSLPWESLWFLSTDVTASPTVSRVECLGTNGIALVQPTGANRPMLGVGPHGKKEAQFTAATHQLASESAITLPANYVIVQVARFIDTPAEAGTFGHLFILLDGATWVDRITYAVGTDAVWVLAQKVNNVPATARDLKKTAVYTEIAGAYPDGELRVNNQLESTSVAGTNTAPVTGVLNVGGASQSAHIGLVMMGILDADKLGANLESDLAAIQAWAASEFAIV